MPISLDSVGGKSTADHYWSRPLQLLGKQYHLSSFHHPPAHGLPHELCRAPRLDLLPTICSTAHGLPHFRGLGSVFCYAQLTLLPTMYPRYAVLILLSKVYPLMHSLYYYLGLSYYPQCISLATAYSTALHAWKIKQAMSSDIDPGQQNRPLLLEWT